MLVEIPALCPSQLVPAYLPDASVRFLLVERDPAAWARSFDSFVGAQWARMHRFPLSLLHGFSAKLRLYDRVMHLFYTYYTGGQDHWTPRDIGSPAVLRALEQGYVEYLERVKGLVVPRERLHVIRLEDGLGWDELCGGFLGVEPPVGVPFPERGGHEEGAASVWADLMGESWAKIGGMAVTVAAVAWWSWTRLSPK